MDSERHPKNCIFFQRGECQWNSNCKYLHKANLEIVENYDKSLDCEEETLDQNLAKAKEFENDDSFLNEEAKEGDTTDSDDLVEEDCAGTLGVKVMPNSWR